MFQYFIITICILYLIWYKQSLKNKETFSQQKEIPYQNIYDTDTNIRHRALCEYLQETNRYDCLYDENLELREDYDTFEHTNETFQTVLDEKVHYDEYLFPAAKAKHIEEEKQSTQVKDRFINSVITTLNKDDRLSVKNKEKLKPIKTYVNYYAKTANKSIIILDMTIIVYRKNKHHGKSIRTLGYVKNAKKVKLIQADVIGIVLENEIKNFPEPKKQIEYRLGDNLPLHSIGCGLIEEIDSYEANILNETKKEAKKIVENKNQQNRNI